MSQRIDRSDVGSLAHGLGIGWWDASCFLIFQTTNWVRHQESAAFMQRLSSAREALAEKIREARSENEEQRETRE